MSNPAYPDDLPSPDFDPVAGLEADDAFHKWSKQRGVWPRLSHYEIFIAGRKSAEPEKKALRDAIEVLLADPAALTSTDVAVLAESHKRRRWARAILASQSIGL